MVHIRPPTSHILGCGPSPVLCENEMLRALGCYFLIMIPISQYINTYHASIDFSINSRWYIHSYSIKYLSSNSVFTCILTSKITHLLVYYSFIFEVLCFTWRIVILMDIDKSYLQTVLSTVIGLCLWRRLLEDFEFFYFILF